MHGKVCGSARNKLIHSGSFKRRPWKFAGAFFLQCDSLFDERILQLQTVLKRKCHMTFTEVWTRAEAKIEPVLRHVQP